MVIPVREVVTVGTSNTATLSNTPATGEPVSVSVMTKDGGIASTLLMADAAAAGKFAIAEKAITVHTDVTEGTQLVVLYKKEVSSAVQIENRADCFAKAGEFWLEVLFVDPCNQAVEYHGFLVFPNAKMSNETTIDFNNEATHGFTIEAVQDYCDPDKKLFYMVVAADEEDGN